MSLLRYRLRRQGFKTVQFSYPTVTQEFSNHIRNLHQFVTSLEANEIHFVAHSLGGLLLQKYLAQYPINIPGRAVTLATPHTGSIVAQVLASHPLTRRLLGHSANTLCGKDLPSWTSDTELGVINGTRTLGLGMLITKLSGKHDGTVMVQETQLKGAKQTLSLPVSHMGALFSASVADAVGEFLSTGRFATDKTIK